MKRDVVGCVVICPTCQLVKAEHQVPSGFFAEFTHAIMEMGYDHNRLCVQSSKDKEL